jgi:glycosyltransferase involved in cell wall biosynthesis
VGRLNHYQKRQDIIIKYFSRLQKKYPNSKLSFFGLGNSENLLRELTVKYNVSNKVYFKESIGNNFLIKELANYSLMISASKEETFGLNVVESLSIGLPVLAFPAKSIKEIADSNPIAFFFKDEESFLSKIDNEMCNITSDEKSKSIQTIKKTFHLNLMISNYDKIYKKLI